MVSLIRSLSTKESGCPVKLNNKQTAPVQSSKDSHGYYKSQKADYSDLGMSDPKNVTKDYMSQGWYGNSDPFKSDNYKEAK